jgi:phosphoglycerol transferase MdoB-like AlkP superfamily enzyme
MSKVKQFHSFTWLFLIYTLLGTVTRVALWLMYARTKETEVAFLTFAGIVPIGIINDFIAYVYLLTLILMPGVLLSQRVTRSKAFNALGTILLFGIIFGMLFISMAEITFFDEFESRFNLIAVSYLIYPTEVIGNIKESYPLPILLSLNFLAAAVVFYIFRKKLQAVPTGDNIPFRKRIAGYTLLVLTAASLQFMVGTNTLYHSNNHTAEEIAANGVSSFFRALNNMDLDFHSYYATLPGSVTAPSLREQLTLDGSVLVSQDIKDLNRKHTNLHPLANGKKLNVVILAEESLGAEFVESLDGKKGLTPVIDSLSMKSLSFTNAFATGTRTVRGLEAISSSFPPIPSESIVKRPGSENIATIGSILRSEGYSTTFLYGGYGLFDNMNHFFSRNGFETYDRSDMTEVKFSNIWGVSDEDLYHNAIGYFREKSAKHQPFFGLVMSTSNHKPYTFPANDAGIPVKGGGRDAGVRYADYAIGKFFDEVKNESWFKDTLFIVIADHDARVYGKSSMPVHRYRIPVLFYAPQYIKPAINAALFSQLDVAPTILGMLGISYTAPFFGQNVLSRQYQSNATRRWVPLNYNFNVGLFNQKRLVMLGVNKDLKGFDCKPSGPGLQSEIMQTASKASADEEHLLVGFFQTAFEAFKDGTYRSPK